jgi:hypothetical protein
MKVRIQHIILAALFLAVCIPVVSAWNVESYAMNLTGPLPQNAPVTVTFVVDFPAEANETTFPAASDLVMTTDLAKPVWSYTITTGDGGSSTTPAFYNQTLDLSGLLLSYRGHGSETMSVTLMGKVPMGTAPANITVLDVHEVDKTGKVVTSSQVTRTAAVSDAVWTTATAQPASTAKIEKQAGLWDQIVGMFKGLFGIVS